MSVISATSCAIAMLTTEQFIAFRDFVHEFAVFLRVFVEEEMKLVERVPRHLPMMLLVHVAEW